MSRTIGLRDISFSKLLTDIKKTEATYGPVKKYERSVSAKLTPKTNSDTSYSDDEVEDIITTFSQVDVEIELNQLSVATRAFLQGSKVINGILIENKDDQAPYVYMAFKSKKANGAFRYVCLFKGKFELVSDEHQTQEDKIKQGTAKLKGTFICREFDGNYRLIADSDDDGVVAADLEKWLTTVPVVPTKSNLTTITVVSGKEAVVTAANGTSLTVASSTTVTNLISAIQVDDGKGSIKVYTDNTKATEATGASNVTSSMVIEATAEDTSTKNTYTITMAA